MELWFAALSPDQQAEARALSGDIPAWMVESLAKSEVMMGTAQMTNDDGSTHTVTLMLGALADFLELERAPIPTTPPPNGQT